MNKTHLKTRIVEFLANVVLPAFEELKEELKFGYFEYNEFDWKSIIDNDSPARLLGLPIKLCELDFNLSSKDYTIVLTIQILEEQDIGGFFSICWEHGTMCAKDLFFDEFVELDAQKLSTRLQTLIERLKKSYTDSY